MIMVELLLPAILAASLLVLIAAPFGCVVVWNRMAYLGDTLAHSALLGVALGASLQLPPLAGLILVCLSIGLLLVVLQNQRNPMLPTDSLLGVLAHSALAIGIVAISLLAPGQIQLMRLLFGDILAVNWQDVGMLVLIGLPALGMLLSRWQALLLSSLHPDLAAAEGIPVERSKLLFTLMLAVIIALSMQLVGALLVTALLILPAAIARPFSRSPEQMAALAVLAGWIGVLGGLYASWHWDVPTGPAMVTALALMFGLVMPLAQLRRAS